MDIQTTSAALLSRPGVEHAGLPEMNTPWFESPFFHELLAERDCTPEQRALVEKFAEDGYVIIESGIPDFDELATQIIATLQGEYKGRTRVIDVWKFNPHAKRLALAPKIAETVKFLYQRDPIPFQTLNFPVGTQQHTHSDTVHFHSVPHRFMCGTWVALEDIDETNGPLHLYPGSHTLPVWNFHDLGLPSSADYYERYEQALDRCVQAMKLRKIKATIKKGQVVIWAANVLHGGEPIVDPTRSRHSQVTHYFFENCLYYTPMFSDPYIGRVAMRKITDIRTGKIVPNIYNGKVIKKIRAFNPYVEKAMSGMGNMADGMKDGIMKKVLFKLSRRA